MEIILNVLDLWLVENANYFLTNNIIIEANEKHDGIKQSLVLSFRDRMASVELLKSGTVDFTIVEFDSEKIVFAETLENQTYENIFIALNDFIKMIVPKT